ncbi:MAG: ParB N-terminal domain-containing protein [Planctomycetota bacterium]
MAKKKTSKKAAPKEGAEQATKKKRASRKASEAASRGLAPGELAAQEAPAATRAVMAQVEADGGAVLAAYPDPLGGTWQLLVALPVDEVVPAPFQRDLSDTHVKKLQGVIDRLDRYLDPIVIVRSPDGAYWTPNGHHRLAAMQRLGARSLTALLVPEFELAYQILALNTEKAPGLKERSLEVIRLARALADLAPAREEDYAVPFDEASLLTIGACYEQNARFSGSVYQSILKRCDAFLGQPLREALGVRAERAQRVLAVDELVTGLVNALKERGIVSSYLRNFVVARINPIAKGSRGAQDFDETIAALRENAEAFDPASVDPSALGGGGGGGEEEE